MEGLRLAVWGADRARDASVLTCPGYSGRNRTHEPFSHDDPAWAASAVLTGPQRVCLNKPVLFRLLGSKHQPPNYVARLKRI